MIVILPVVYLEDFHPLIYWWCAFYKDGTCLPKFDMKTGKANMFEDIDQTKLERFGLFPFNAPLAILVNMAEGKVIAREVENLPYFIMKTEENQRLIYVRQCGIHQVDYYHCDKCGYEWKWNFGRKEGETDCGIPIFPNHVVQEWNGRKFPLAQCPKCNSLNAIVCPECKDILINELKRPDSEEHYFKCPKCNKEYPRFLHVCNETLRTAIYIIGYQVTIDGRNVKQLMYINEDGTFSLK